jgi:polyisoprenoid-binding protein YceI
VAIPAGTYRFGPDNATLALNTGRTGKVARVGHDLLIHVSSWEGTLAVGADPADIRVEVTADGGSMQVIEGTGGMKSLDDDDKANIAQTIDEEVLRKQEITFRSSAVEPDGGGLRVQGDMTLSGHTRPITVAIAVAGEGALTATAVLKQTDFGMTPYTALFGALKVADEVRVTLTATVAQSR